LVLRKTIFFSKEHFNTELFDECGIKQYGQNKQYKVSRMKLYQP